MLDFSKSVPVNEQSEYIDLFKFFGVELLL